MDFRTRQNDDDAFYDNAEAALIAKNARADNQSRKNFIFDPKNIVLRQDSAYDSISTSLTSFSELDSSQTGKVY